MSGPNKTVAAFRSRKWWEFDSLEFRREHEAIEFAERARKFFKVRKDVRVRRGSYKFGANPSRWNGYKPTPRKFVVRIYVAGDDHVPHDWKQKMERVEQGAE